MRVFACKTTFERALVFKGTLEMFARATDDVGAPTVARLLRKGGESLADEEVDEEKKKRILNSLRNRVLNTARRFGKARFAQIAARHADQAKHIPKYIDEAVAWLTAP